MAKKFLYAKKYTDLKKSTPLPVVTLVTNRVTLIVPACPPGWEEMENFRGNLRGNNSK